MKEEQRMNLLQSLDSSLLCGGALISVFLSIITVVVFHFWSQRRKGPIKEGDFGFPISEWKSQQDERQVGPICRIFLCMSDNCRVCVWLWQDTSVKMQRTEVVNGSFGAYRL